MDIRTATDEHSEVWFCAKDVCEALDIEWSSHTLDNMPENWFMVVKLTTIKGERDAYFINEAGLYHLIFRSNKPKANQISISKQIDSISSQIVNTKNAYRRRLLQDQLRRLCNIVNQPIPPDDWIEKEWNQVDLFDSTQAKLT